MYDRAVGFGQWLPRWEEDHCSWKLEGAVDFGQWLGKTIVQMFLVEIEGAAPPGQLSSRESNHDGFL